MPENRLAHETSPYLRQHKDNPVDWFPWGKEAFEKAGREDKPIFLSIGYSACHWCHVMAHESFEDEETARFLNARFVPVKVDREERPDVDALYMRAVLMMTGSGGWPLSVFLDPDLKPFYGGTYFPLRARYGVPAFMDVLRAVDEAFVQRREELKESSEGVMRAVASSFEGRPSEDVPGLEAASAARKALMARFDERGGGFGTGPKFPQPALLEFLLDEDARHPELGLRGKIFLTLDKMARGGVRDQVGGGFHRYSVDGEWRVPHFEKMLYDNAQLASLYARAARISGDSAFRETAQEILVDMIRSMGAGDGGFVAAIDADSGGEEGRFYLWTRDELIQVLGEADAGFMAEVYGIQAAPGGLEDRILHRVMDWEVAAGKFGGETDSVRERAAGLLKSLRRARDERVRPGIDTKVLTNWNALAAEAFLEGADVTGRTDFLETGLSILRFLWEKTWDGRTLYHVWDGSRARTPGLLSDYVFLARAFQRAFQAEGSLLHLERSGMLLGAAVERFLDRERGVFYESVPEGPAPVPLAVREREDGVLPSALSVLARLLLERHRLTDEDRWLELLEDVLRSEGASMKDLPGALPLLAGAAALLRLPAAAVVVSGPGMTREVRAMLRSARKSSPPGCPVVPLLWDRVSAAEAENLSLFRGRRLEAKVKAWVCVGTACLPPVSEPPELKIILEEASARMRAAATGPG
ncbi:MAG: thioredoxin domain-containing protein [Acidobacteriota bacterium]